MNISSVKPHPTAGKSPVKSPATPSQSNEIKDWTVLLYIAGDNDLEPYAAHMMQQLEDQCGSSDSINVVAQLGRMSQNSLRQLYQSQGREYQPTNIDGDWSGMRRYLVTQQERGPKQEHKILSPVVGKPDDKRMSNPTALADFLVWGMKNYPSKHVLMALADHGGAWLGAFTSDASASDSSIMQPDDIASAFKVAETATGKKPEVIDMVACLMATSEVAYQMKDRGKYLLASEELGTTAAFDYGPVINHLEQASQKGRSLSPKAVAQAIVHHYDERPEAFKTKSAIDLSKMAALKTSFQQLVTTLKASKIPPETVAQAIEDSQKFGLSETQIYPFYDQIHDLEGLALNLSDPERVSDRKVRKAAAAVVEAVEASVVDNLAHSYTRTEVTGESLSLDGKEKITDFREYSGQYQAHGLSLFAPLDPYLVEGPQMQQYQDLDFVRETGWGDYLRQLNADLNPPTTPTEKIATRPHTPPANSNKKG